VKRKRGGGSNVVGFLLLIGLLGLFYEWPSFIDRSGVEATARITEKREGIRIPFDNWFRSFSIVAAFRVPGAVIENHAVCDVEEGVYDSLHVGAAVTVHYWPSLLPQPFIPATHLSPCTPRANFTSNPELYRKLEIVLGSLVAIAFLVFVLRWRIAVWLFVPWFYFFLIVAAVPQAEPAPSEPRLAQGRVRNITTITAIMENNGAQNAHSVTFGPIKLEHPFQIVEMEFTPAGRTDPVVGIDAIDVNSIPNIQKQQTVEIEYDLNNPRIARLRGGTRDFPGQAKRQVLIVFGVIMAFFLAIVAGWRILRFFSPRSRRRTGVGSRR
jgi:hypothetical protein